MEGRGSGSWMVPTGEVGGRTRWWEAKMWSMSSGLPCRSGVALVGADERREVDHAQAVALARERKLGAGGGVDFEPDG